MSDGELDFKYNKTYDLNLIPPMKGRFNSEGIRAHQASNQIFDIQIESSGFNISFKVYGNGLKPKLFDKKTKW